MNTIVANRLQTGDEVRVIAPSRSLSIIGDMTRKIADERFRKLGVRVTFATNAEETDDFVSSSIASRLEDIHEAFRDPQVKAILTAIGGFNSNQLLEQLDWDLIRKNPKIFCGFSDITALSNAIYAKTGLVTYCGPHYSSFGMEQGFEYTLNSFIASMMNDNEIVIVPSDEWSDDMWFLDQQKRTFFKNDGWLPLQQGLAEGTIIGGNLSTLQLLSNTPYMPTADDILLFLEDDEESMIHHFDRALTALTQQPWFASVRGVVIGRFQRASETTEDLIRQMVIRNAKLNGLPVLSNVDFGHTTPMLTLPIGGYASMTSGLNSSIKISKH